MKNMRLIIFSFLKSPAGINYEYDESCKGDWFRLKNKRNNNFVFIKLIEPDRRSPIDIPPNNDRVFLLVKGNSGFHVYKNKDTINDCKVAIDDIGKLFQEVEPPIEVGDKDIYRYKKLYDLYNSDSNKKKGFGSFKRFYDWWLKQYFLNNGKCEYCKVDEHKIEELARSRKLRLRENRGLVLEVDRRDPNRGYGEDNCALVCYFCNNDKSNIFNEEEYKKFFQNRKRYIDDLYRS